MLLFKNAKKNSILGSSTASLLQLERLVSERYAKGKWFDT